MSSDRSAIAFARLDVAADGDEPAAAAPACDLAELASALAQVETLVAAGADGSPDAAAALERIADIAFILHEREVEPSLCDALDAATREIGEANARNRASVQRLQEAAELLRALARRLDAMMTAQALRPATDVAPGALQGLANDDELECADEFPAPARWFDTEVAQEGTFARTVAALAQSLPEQSDAAPARFQDHGAASGAAPDALAQSFDVEPEQAEAAPNAWVQVEIPASGLAEEEAVPCASPASSIDAAAAPALDTYRSVDPGEDPGDLFEPMPGMRPAADAPAPPAVMSAATQEAAPPASLAPRSTDTPSDAPTHVATQTAANDPLAPIRALSEEELIALFS